MKTLILDVEKLKRFSDEKRHQETIWSDDHARINLLCMKPGQEVTTHTHHGHHMWIVMEGMGEYMSAGEKQVIEPGKIVIVPPLVDHGIRNAGHGNLVIASIAAAGD